MKTILLLAGLLAVLCAAANADPLVEVGDDSFGLTVQSAERTTAGIHVRLLIENLTRSRAVFLHHEADESDAQDYFFLPAARTNRQDRATFILPIAPAGTRSVDVVFPLKYDQKPGLLVLGDDRPPFDQVAVALAPLIAQLPAQPAKAPEFALALATPSPQPVKLASQSVLLAERPPADPARSAHRPVPRPTGPARAQVARGKTVSPHLRIFPAVPGSPARAAGRAKPLAKPPAKRFHAVVRPVRVAAARPARHELADTGSVIFLPQNSTDHALSVYRPPLPRFGRALILWAGHSGSDGYGWTEIHAQHPDVRSSEIAYAATYPHQIWTDGRTYLFVRWDEEHGNALVLQVAGDSVISARRATYDDLVFWLGPGKIYPRLIYRGGS